MAVPYGFSKGRSGEIRLNLDEFERSILSSFTDQIIAFVAPEPADESADPLAEMVGISDTATAPEDPALARLLPDAFIDDDAAAAEFRRFTERDLRAVKVTHATTVRQDLADGMTVLPDDHVSAWLGFLNDARLTLGTRLEITEDDQDRITRDDDPRAALFQAYDWLTYLQDSLVQLLLP